MRWPAHWPCWTVRRWRRERRRHHRPAVLGRGSPGLPGRRGERGGAHAPGRGAGRGRGRAGRPGGGGAAARRRAHLRSGRQRAAADGGHRQPARRDRRGVAGAVVRRGRDRAGPAARGGQALPVRRCAQLLREAVRGVGAHAGRPGRPDDRRGGRRVRDPAVRERGGRGAAMGRGGQEPGQRRPRLRPFPAAAAEPAAAALSAGRARRAPGASAPAASGWVTVPDRRSAGTAR